MKNKVKIVTTTVAELREAEKLILKEYQQTTLKN